MFRLVCIIGFILVQFNIALAQRNIAGINELPSLETLNWDSSIIVLNSSHLLRQKRNTEFQADTNDHFKYEDFLHNGGENKLESILEEYVDEATNKAKLLALSLRGVGTSPAFIAAKKEFDKLSQHVSFAQRMINLIHVNHVWQPTPGNSAAKLAQLLGDTLEKWDLSRQGLTTLHKGDEKRVYVTTEIGRWYLPNFYFHAYTIARNEPDRVRSGGISDSADRLNELQHKITTAVNRLKAGTGSLVIAGTWLPLELRHSPSVRSRFFLNGRVGWEDIKWSEDETNLEGINFDAEMQLAFIAKPWEEFEFGFDLRGMVAGKNAHFMEGTGHAGYDALLQGSFAGYLQFFRKLRVSVEYATVPIQFKEYKYPAVPKWTVSIIP
jgi:hypothetical protein